MFDSDAYFATLEEMVAAAAEGVRPPKRNTVPQTAAEIRFLNNPGAYTGPWKNETVPYLVEPQEILTSLEYTAMIFVGPAQAGKTDMFLNWLTHTVVNDPADMMLIQTAQNTARDFARRRVDRLHRHTPETGKRLIRRRDADSTFTKQYLSGMMLTLSWPTINELSGRPVPRLWLTDYDRMVQDVDGEGSAFDLARKRATTFRRHGMTAAESSPGFLVNDPKWSKPHPGSHMAPPCDGILSLYNRGDRRLYYWQCHACSNWFEPDFPLLHYPDSADPMEAGELAVMICPHCQTWIPHDRDEVKGLPGKYDMNINGLWIPEGMSADRNRVLSGQKIRSDIASFWLKGVCAAFADWKTLVINYEKAKAEYEQTGSETALKTTVNTDQGRAYVPKKLSEGRQVDTLKSRVLQGFAPGTVPRGVRYIVMTVDIQKNRFVVQAQGHGVGGDVWVIEQFTIRKSNRKDDDGERWPVAPHAYIEDWDLLYTEVMQRTYPLADDSGRRMRVRMTGSDSGGRAGVTEKAYAFWLKLRDNEVNEETGEHQYEPGSHLRLRLLKGRSQRETPRVQLSYPDSERKDRHAGARGEVPVLLLNTNMLKNEVDNSFDRIEPEGGRFYFPEGMPEAFYNELTVETKNAKGEWENERKLPNEAFDLLCYGRAISLYRPINAESIDWKNPPSWADEWDNNEMVFDPNETGPVAAKASELYDFAQLGDALA